MFNNALKGDIENAISKAALQQGQQSLNNMLGQFHTGIPIAHGIGVDYDLVQSPSVQNDYLTVYSLAMFIDTNNPNYAPPVPTAAPLPAYNPNQGQIQIAISDYTLNTGMFTTYQAGLLQYTITPDLIPSSSPVSLDTTSLDSFFPGLEAAYGEKVPCNLDCAAASPAPQISSVNGSIKGTATANCAILVKGVTKAVGLTITIGFNATIALSSWEVQGNINSAEVTSIVAYENTLNQAIDVNGLTFMFNMGLGLVAPFADKTYLNPGVVLPHIDNLDLSDGSVTVGNGYVYLQATPVYRLGEIKPSRVEI